MKRVILTIVGMMVGLVFVNAQTDSTNTTGAMQSPGLHPTEYQKQNRVTVKSTDIPNSLKQTLKGSSDYKGWENATIYRDKNTNQYSIDLANGGTTTTYYFDKSGKAVTSSSPSYNSSGDPNGNSSGNTNNSSGSRSGTSK